jgi:hypothetical protein
MVDVGGTSGALVVYAPATLHGAELEISRAGEPSRSHVFVLPRRVAAGLRFAAVYPQLSAGSYQVWPPVGGRPRDVEVHGGRVTETSLDGAE